MSPEQVLALAPDAASASAGKGLANPRKWSNLGATEGAIWGECQGSGSKPYQAQIDPTEPAFKCSCPSRKFPCKHCLGLFLLFATQNELFTQDGHLEWVEKWQESRRNRAEKATQKTEERVSKPVDAKAAVKRGADREAKVEGGLRELELWMEDLLRNGLATAPQQSYTFWDAMAARLIDAQCPGLARRVRELAGVASSGRGWEKRLLERLSKIHLIVQGWKQRSALTEGLVAELRAQIGWTIKEDELDSTDAVTDEWWVLGQRIYGEGDIRIARSWLWGQTSLRAALYLQFAHMSQPLLPRFVPNTRVRATAVYYPGALPVRAVFRDQGPVEPLPKESSADIFGKTIASATAEYASTLALHPWLDVLPVVLKEVTLQRASSRWHVQDADGLRWPVSSDWRDQWQLLSETGGAAAMLCGEWDGLSFRPLGRLL